MASLTRFSQDFQLTSLEESLKSPNVFNVLRLERAEIRHSNFLGWLFDPDGTHKLGATFLSRFYADSVGKHFPELGVAFATERLHQPEVTVRREMGNIDLLIETRQFVIVIENKVDSVDHDNQLSTYRRNIERQFAHKQRAYIYLTCDRSEPTQVEERGHWLLYSYTEIASLLDELLRNEMKHERAAIYIHDYLTVLRRDIMKDDEATRLARKLYKDHRDAIDFIVKSIPNPSRAFERIVENEGWILESSPKGFTRFLPKSLVDIIPRTGEDSSWKRRAMLFEFWYEREVIRFAVGVAPDAGNNRSVLAQAIRNLPQAGEFTRGKFLVYFEQERTYDVSRSSSEDELESVIREMIPKIRSDVSSVVAAILNVKDQLSRLST